MYGGLREFVSLVCAAEAMPLTQGEVGLVHWLDERLCRSDNTVTEVSAAHPSPVKGRREI